MVKRIKCIKCKDATVGHFDGKILNLRRQKDSFVLHGEGWSVMTSCPRCGTMNNIGMEKDMNGNPEMVTSCPTEEIDYQKMSEEKNTNNTNEEVKNEQENNNGSESSDQGGQADNSGSDGGSDSAS